ncbi:butyrophilin subfamily 1 member A1-like, partial [Rhineura floridana]|uniref:butyrophilin subfamily 1 member A1-like n=1 Tax=Rhineura floridana TaxID=261503 RepID=UPI002AC866CA
GKSIGHVTLDPDTAHPLLVVCDDQKSVMWRGEKQDLPKNPERFEKMFCVLGCERFTSGRHCWEVEVEAGWKETMWAVGVAKESVQRKGVVGFCPKKGFWAVGKDFSVSVFPGQFWAFRSSKPNLLKLRWFWETPLTLSREPRKIRVSLDYEEGCVKFFDADTNESVFTFTSASFSGEEVRPFFWLNAGVVLKC